MEENPNSICNSSLNPNNNSNNGHKPTNQVASAGEKGGKGAAAADCSNCGTQSGGGWALHHNVRIRGALRRLCTSCVLRLHPASFCPFCFHCHHHILHTPSSSNFLNSQNTPDPTKNTEQPHLLSCTKCSSLAHAHCLPTTSSPSFFLCPACASDSPNYSFNLNKSNKLLDDRLAVVLLCAAKIAVASMSKAVVIARAVAERRAREAALARKRAHEALDRLALVVSQPNHPCLCRRRRRRAPKAKAKAIRTTELSSGSNDKTASNAHQNLDAKQNVKLELKE